MKLVSKIFRRTDWYVTSKFGMRVHPINGKYSMHNGTDYGTHGKKIPQYAIEEGYVVKVVTGQNKATTGYGNYVWVRYPRINRSLLHAHLDSVKVKKGDKVKEGTILGYTGTTGASTGVHLHLGMTKIGSDTWLDPHAYNYEEPKKEEVKPTKSIDEVAKDVISGKYGNYPERKTKLEKEGYNYSEVQSRVNEILNGTKKVSFKTGDKVVPTKLVDYNGKKIVQYDKNYVITSISGNRAVLAANRSGKLYTWAAMNINNIKKV
jgi:murein DD-endopeptidase MepM/ murein hydrolase activator NlpD